MTAEGEQADALPQHTEVEEEPELAHQVEEDDEEEGEEGDVSLLITEFDSDEEPDEVLPREVEEEEEEEESDIRHALATSAPQCCCATPLAAIKQAFQHWASYNAERKQMLEPLREAYTVARANCMSHRYVDFSWK